MFEKGLPFFSGGLYVSRVTESSMRRLSASRCALARPGRERFCSRGSQDGSQDARTPSHESPPGWYTPWSGKP